MIEIIFSDKEFEIIQNYCSNGIKNIEKELDLELKGSFNTTELIAFKKKLKILSRPETKF